MENRKLIYVYTSAGQLVNNTPFIGVEKAAKYIESKGLSLEDNIYESNVMEVYFTKMILNHCHTNGEKIWGYYFRTRPTTVFKTAQKFKTVKVY